MSPFEPFDAFPKQALLHTLSFKPFMATGLKGLKG